MRFKLENTTQSIKNGKPIKHYKFPEFPKQEEALENTTLDEYIWRAGDKFSSLAYKFYGDVHLWWVIAWFNKTPLETGLVPGDVIVIPRNVEYIVSLF